MSDLFQIRNTAFLSETQKSEIHSLLETSTDFDGYLYDCFTENDLICADNFPCFFLLYSAKNTLVSFLSLYLEADNHMIKNNNKYNLYIYAITCPKSRNQGCFSNLLDYATRQIKQSLILIKNTYFPINKKNINDSLTHFIQSHYISYDYSECLMKITSDFIHLSYTKELEIEYEENQYGNEYSLWKNDKYIGGCLIEYINHMEAIIYQFGIIDEEQGKGYGRLGLIQICNELFYRKFLTVSLQVTSQNKKAHRLYIDCGFKIVDEIQYMLLQ